MATILKCSNNCLSIEYMRQVPPANPCIIIFTYTFRRSARSAYVPSIPFCKQTKVGVRIQEHRGLSMASKLWLKWWTYSGVGLKLSDDWLYETCILEKAEWQAIILPFLLVRVICNKEQRIAHAFLSFSSSIPNWNNQNEGSVFLTAHMLPILSKSVQQLPRLLLFEQSLKVK